jgi:hypothetical protein
MKPSILQFLHNGSFELLPKATKQSFLNTLQTKRLYPFALRAMQELVGVERCYHNYHLEVISHWLELCAAGEKKRLIVNMPPRHLKTTLCNVIFPAWLSFVLFHWFNDAEDVCKDFVKRLVNSSEQGLLSFMKSKLNMTTSSSHGVYWTMPLKNVSKFIALEEIEPLIDRINVDSLTDRKAKIAITCFRKAKIDNFQDDNKIRDDLDKIAVMDDEFN